MRLILTIAACLCLAWGNSAQAQTRLVSYQYQSSHTKADVQTILNNFGVPAGFIKPEFDVEVYKVLYITRNAQNTDTCTASGALVVPVTNGCPLPLVAYHHGTTLERYGVPSYGSDEIFLGIIFASANGFVATLPDYLGLGDSRGFHPYVHAGTQASASVDLLRTARELADSLNYNLNGQLFLFGYSQGGHAAMATAREIETNLSGEFTLTAAAPMSGPYDVSGIQAQNITSGQPYSSPSYLPYIIMGYQEVYGDIYNNLSDVFKSPYDSLIPIWYDGTRGAGYVDARLPAVVSQMIDSTMYQDYLNNPNNPLRVHLRDNDVYQWTPNAPLRMLYCQGDEQVFYRNAEIAFDTMTARGAQNVSKANFGNYDHFGCLQFCMLDGNNFFSQYKDLLNGLQFSGQITNVSADGQTDGAISIQATGGVAPYTYEWANGQTTATLNNLPRGGYFVRVSDSRGCFGYQNLVVNLPSGLDNNNSVDNLFNIAPNPANNWVEIQNIALGESQIFVYNPVGQLVLQQNVYNQTQISLNSESWAAGIYLIMVRNGYQYQQKQLIIEK